MRSADGRVLLICYYFPPLGGAGVGRPLSLARYLPEFGYNCDVLTVKPVTYRVYEPELLTEIDSDRIYRAGSWDPQRLMYLLGMRTVKEKLIESGRKASDRFFPDSKVGWVSPAVRLGRQLLSAQKYDAIISTSPPVSCHLVARRLARETGIPWIADFRDFWTSFKVEDHYRDSRKVAKALALLKQIKEGASLLTTISPTIADYLEKAVIIPNSFDRQLAALWQSPIVGDSSTNDNKFIIGLFGTFGEIYPVQPLLELLSRLREKSQAAFDQIKVLQIGNTEHGWLSEQVEKYKLSDSFELVGFLPREEAIKRLSDVRLFYLGLPSDSRREREFTPGRIYYMLASGRPILAAVPPGSEIHRIVSESQNGFCFKPDIPAGTDDPAGTDIPAGTDDPGKAVSYLSDQVLKWQEKAVAISPLPDYSLKYSSDRMVAAFADRIRELANHSYPT